MFWQWWNENVFVFVTSRNVLAILNEIIFYWICKSAPLVTLPVSVTNK